ncbi:MAG: S-methyl-5-thioribose-1-phosphate isomerase [Candidatus Omnitrophica bacterium]|nr:S-methyl-5-thioribose-1-phosphate isomerase [Candidatus Omnitrophota bacterium]
MTQLRVIWWEENGVGLIDQTLLPHKEKEIVCETLESLWEAIKSLRVRGAPAIGVSAAYGAVLAAKLCQKSDPKKFAEEVKEGCDYLATSRPTAVNLFWALDRMKRKVDEVSDRPIEEQREALLEEAYAIEHENNEVCERLSIAGAELLGEESQVITHCNAGGLACGNYYGTALGVILKAAEHGKKIGVYVDETRPLLQGSRLTAFELMKAGVEATLICDNMAGHVMKTKDVDAVIFGADRIAANGDTANKIGSYSLAVQAKEHGIPVYVAAPLSTVDFSLASGDEIPIEERLPEEVAGWQTTRTAPRDVKVYNPAFDVTPAKYITAIICEEGVLHPPFEESLGKLKR